MSGRVRYAGKVCLWVTHVENDWTVALGSATPLYVSKHRHHSQPLSIYVEPITLPIWSSAGKWSNSLADSRKSCKLSTVKILPASITTARHLSRCFYSTSVLCFTISLQPSPRIRSDDWNVVISRWFSSQPVQRHQYWSAGADLGDNSGWRP